VTGIIPFECDGFSPQSLIQVFAVFNHSAVRRKRFIVCELPGKNNCIGEGGENMGAKRKPAQMERKAYFERQLKDRMAFLTKKGIEPPQIKKDTILKKLRANIEALNARLKTIARYEEQTAGLAKKKAEKAAVPKKDPEDRKEKKAKEAPVEAKEKKKKKKEEAS
jgi:hypothetical protein